ncbi:MAG: ParA family protein [Candidimonas sp.]|nr:MAG: ParA family protein [Candidimonas sp.]TAM26979.1 MAG: ParA family protein [Candidimonas sp.]TAM77264.1 MAG: ParA family protein [Candidimonas sp.]
MNPPVTRKPAQVFCIANQKGGVGKTTTAINLAAALSTHGKRVLLIDLDPQGNATMGSGINKNTVEKNLYQVLIGTATIAQARVRSEAGAYDVLPANRELSGAEIDLVQMDDREQQLKQAIDLIIADYDFILIDCPPTLSLLTLNGLASAHGVIIPMQCEYFALEGLSDLVNTVKRVHRNINPELHLIGLLRVMFDPRVTLQQQVSAQIETHFGDKVFKSIVPRNVRLAEAPSHGLPGIVYDKNSRGAKAYIEFGNELIKRIKQEAAQAGS